MKLFSWFVCHLCYRFYSAAFPLMCMTLSSEMNLYVLVPVDLGVVLLYGWDTLLFEVCVFTELY